jgi:hypothetical protein
VRDLAAKSALPPVPTYQDLEQHPNNGWSLLGLWHVSKVGAGGNDDDSALPEERAAQHQFHAAWAASEVQIDSSCPALARAFKL